MNVSLDGVKPRFKRVKYLLCWTPAPVLVHGFAFETPGWPEFHACVRWGSRFRIEDDNLFNRWLVDHFESGRAIALPEFQRKEDAPAALAKRLNEVGRDDVVRCLLKYAA